MSKAFANENEQATPHEGGEMPFGIRSVGENNSWHSVETVAFITIVLLTALIVVRVILAFKNRKRNKEKSLFSDRKAKTIDEEFEELKSRYAEVGDSNKENIEQCLPSDAAHLAGLARLLLSQIDNRVSPSMTVQDMASLSDFGLNASDSPSKEDLEAFFKTLDLMAYSSQMDLPEWNKCLQIFSAWLKLGKESKTRSENGGQK